MRATAALAGLPMLLLSACATAPTYTKADDQALDPVRQKYQNCIATRTADFINGSDDVRFLVEQIVHQCDGQLLPVKTYLTGRGFSDYYISQYIEGIRGEARDVTSSFILRAKGGAS